MFFNKEKIYMGSFIRGMLGVILAKQTYTFEDYLKNDPNELLSEEEFDAFTQQLPLFRNLLIFALLQEAIATGRINYPSDNLGITFINGFALVAEDNNYSVEKIESTQKELASELDAYLGYLQNISDEDLSSNSYVVHICMYFGERFTSNSFDIDKQGTYVALINGQKRVIKEYFEDVIKKVKIIG